VLSENPVLKIAACAMPNANQSLLIDSGEGVGKERLRPIIRLYPRSVSQSRRPSERFIQHLSDELLTEIVHSTRHPAALLVGCKSRAFTIMPAVGTPQLSIIRKCFIINGINAKYLSTLRALSTEKPIFVGRKVDLHCKDVSPPANNSRTFRHAIPSDIAIQG